MPHSIPLVISHWYHVLNKPSLKNHKTNHTGKFHHFIASSRLADYHKVLLISEFSLFMCHFNVICRGTMLGTMLGTLLELTLGSIH